MKKVIYLFILFCLVGSFVFLGLSTNVARADTSQDQKCTFTPSAWTNLTANNYMNESFAPTMDTLTKVTVSLGGSGSFTFAIYDDFHNMLYSTNVNITAVGLKDISFDPITVSPNATYHIHFNHAVTGSESWAHTADDSCYSRGIATMGTAQLGNGDFYFITYGYNASQNNGNSGTSTTSSQQPSTNTSSDVKPATNLKATDVPNDAGGAIQLSWTATTTSDIDGYRVYRSTNNSDSFMSVGQVTKGTPSFIDYHATVGQKYYYFVRAYKANSESEDSNHVGLASVNNLATTTPKSFMEKYGTWVYVGGGVVLLLIVGSLILVFALSRKKAKIN